MSAAIFAFVLQTGGVGLLLVGLLDSSFLVAPWGNDLLLIGMTASHPSVRNALYYAAMSTLGSVGGCLLLDLTLRPAGAKGLERHLSKKKLERVRGKVGHRAGTALVVASLAPPPFPFTAFVMGAAALQYPRRRLLAIVGVTRMARFTFLGLLALRFGKRILEWGKSPVVEWLAVGLIVISIVGSVVSVYGWIRRSRG